MKGFKVTDAGMAAQLFGPDAQLNGAQPAAARAALCCGL